MNDTVQCKFTFGTLNAIACGACSEYCISGMSRAKFSTDNKLLTNEMMYDVMGFLEQLLAASVRTVAFEAGASCLESALVVASEEARIITLAKAPFSIISANLVWTRLTRHTQVKQRERIFLMFSTQQGVTTTNFFNSQKMSQALADALLSRIFTTPKLVESLQTLFAPTPFPSTVCVNVFRVKTIFSLDQQPVHIFFDSPPDEITHLLRVFTNLSPR